MDLVWRVATQDVPNLKEEIGRIINNHLPPNDII